MILSSVLKKLEFLGYRNAQAEDDGLSLTILAEGTNGTVEFTGGRTQAASWVNGLELVKDDRMSAEEWDECYGDMGDGDIQLLPPLSEMWATEVDEGCIAIVPVTDSVTMCDQVKNLAVFEAQCLLEQKRKEYRMSEGEVLEAPVNVLETDKTVILLPAAEVPVQKSRIVWLDPAPTQEQPADNGPWGIVQQAFLNKVAVTIEYMDKTGAVSTRTVRIAALGETRMYAYCYLRQAPRHFLKEGVQFAALRPDYGPEKALEAAKGLGFFKPRRSGYVWATPTTDEVICNGGHPHWAPADATLFQNGWSK